MFEGKSTRVAIQVQSESMTAAIWLADRHNETESGFPRHDSIRIKIDRTTGIADIRMLLDIGLPILQLHLAEYHPREADHESFFGFLQNDSSAHALGEALLHAILAQATGMALTARLNEPPATASQEIDIDALIYGASLEQPVFEIDQEELVTLSPEVARIGFETNLMTADGDLIRPGANVLLKSEQVLSAFLSVEIMLNDHATNQLPLPNGFQLIDLVAARQALKAVTTPRATSVHYFGDQSSPHHARRLQAAQAYPLLAELLANEPDLRQCVDAAQPLGPALCQRIGASRGHLKRLAKLQSPPPCERVFEPGEIAENDDAAAVGRTRLYRIRGELSLQQTFDVINRFPANWVPNCDEDWAAFADIVSSCALPIAARHGLELFDLLSPVKGDWGSYKASLARAYDIPLAELDGRYLALATADALEMVDDFNRSVILPLLLSSIVRSDHAFPLPTPDIFMRGQAIGFEIITGKAKNIPGHLLTAARAWTTRIPALMEAETVVAPSIEQNDIPELDEWSWPRLAEPFRCANGLVVQNLTSREELKEESQRLCHCVGRLYLRKAKSGRCHIFSIRNADLSTSHSTIELSQITDGPDNRSQASLKILQHKAMKNRKPGRQAIEASTEWLEALRSGNHPVDFETARSWRRQQTENECQETPAGGESRAQIEVKWAASLGRDWHQEDVRQAIWEEWRTHILHGHLARARNPEFLYRNAELRQLLTDLCPHFELGATDSS